MNINVYIKGITGKLFLEDSIVSGICLLGRGSECCKYLVAGASGFECAKLRPDLKAEIDSLNFIAKGDNCEGIRMLNTSKILEN